MEEPFVFYKYGACKVQNPITVRGEILQALRSKTFIENKSVKISPPWCSDHFKSLQYTLSRCFRKGRRRGRSRLWLAACLVTTPPSCSLSSQQRRISSGQSEGPQVLGHPTEKKPTARALQEKPFMREKHKVHMEWTRSKKWPAKNLVK